MACRGQNGRYNNWYFGYYKGITFNSGTPALLTGSQIQTDENSATISDAAGNLLFYTNGLSVWDKNNNLMPNGSGLFSWGDVQQGSLIVPYPGNSDLYYVFTIGLSGTASGYSKDLVYSIVDMTLNGGNGDITAKNVLLDTDVTEKLTATRTNDGSGFWIVEHSFNSNHFKSYLITSSGLSTTPVISSAGITISSTTLGSFSFTGAIKISNNGCWLLSTIRETAAGTGKIELFHFDNMTGIVSGGTAANIPHPYGLEFSPDNTRFYIGQNDYSPIYQYDLTAGSDPLILASQTAVSGIIWCTFSFQLAPDNKIYFAQCADSLLGAIEYPNIPGSACGVNEHALVVPSGTGNNCGLPNNYNLTYNGLLSCLHNSISESDRPVLTVFPNPVGDQFSISGAGNEPVTVVLFDVLSRQVLQKTIRGDESINTGGLPQGLYFYELWISDKRISDGKIIKN
ncbi:MAG: T9SS type A sorting domain-containing protein [Bacteroidia bacterium]